MAAPLLPSTFDAHKRLRAATLARGLAGMTGFPELGVAGLVLWRLTGSEADQLRCEVKLTGDALTLSVSQVGTGDVVVSEPHRDLESLVPRAEQLRDSCLAVGWRELSDDDQNVRPHEGGGHWPCSPS